MSHLGSVLPWMALAERKFESVSPCDTPHPSSGRPLVLCSVRARLMRRVISTMRTLLLLSLLSFSVPAHADFFDDPYGTFGNSQREFDKMIANGSISPPPMDADENG